MMNKTTRLTAGAARTELKAMENPKRAELNMSFMRARKGEYAEGDRFHGLTVPQVRAVGKRYKDLALGEIAKLLASPMHEERLLALVILVERFRRAREERAREELVRFYLAHLGGVNHWDLVDVSAGQILGAHLLGKRDRKVLYGFARSPRLWTRRVAMVATQGLIRGGDLDDAFKLAELLLADSHDLMHKAVGWMLREAGKKDVARLRAFLDRHAGAMPRTMLRYSLEKLPEKERRRYMEMPRVVAHASRKKNV